MLWKQYLMQHILYLILLLQYYFLYIQILCGVVLKNPPPQLAPQLGRQNAA